jgi:hypothetical protein
MTYVIKSIRHKDGTPHEREVRRKGQRVSIISCRVGSSMIYGYVDDGSVVHTSMIIDALVGEGELVVWTQNTEYTFVKEVAPIASE